LDRIAYGEDEACLTEVTLDSYCFLRDAESDYEYLEFICPISKLIKYAFPVKHNKRLICVVFVGQYYIPVGFKKINTKTFFSKVYESKEDLRAYISCFIVPEIIRFHMTTNSNLDEQEKGGLYSLLSEAENHLGRLMMEALPYKYHSKQEDFSTAVLRIFWENVKTAYCNLFEELGADKAYIYIDDDFSDSTRSSRYLFGRNIYSVGNTHLPDIKQQGTFDLSKAGEISKRIQKENIASTAPIREELQACFIDLLVDPIYQYDFVFGNNETHLPYAILLRYPNRNISDTVVDLLRKIAINIRVELSSVLTRLSEYTTKTVLRIYRHEIVHQVLALRSHINNLDPEDKIHISQEKLDRIFFDCSDCLDALAFMTENIELFTNQSTSAVQSVVESCEYETVDIFKDVINKHIAMHRELRDSKNLWFVPTGRTVGSAQFECPQKLLNLVLFNIISNAVKYAYSDTNICLNYSLAEEKYNTRRLEICDFGSEVPLSNEIYRLYYRGTSVENAETGSGIGLFISKRIAETIGVKLYHTCRKISDYNVPLLEAYLRICEEYDGRYKANAPSIELIADELERLKKTKEYNQIVNTSVKRESKLCADEIVSKLVKPTYEVRFVLEL
jgi:signal transduction histidine kinase